MREFGWLLMVAGVVISGLALTMDVTVTTYDPSGLLPGSVVNLHLLQQQGMAFYGGLGLFIAGVVALGLGKIEHAVGAVNRAEDSGEQDRPEPFDSSTSYIAIGVVGLALVALVATLTLPKSGGSSAETNLAVQNALDAANEALADLQNASDSLARAR